MFNPATNWTLMAGYSHCTMPFDNTEVLFNILAPAVIEQHLTLGLSKKFDDCEVNISFMYAPTGTIEGKNPLEAPNQQYIKLEMTQWQLEFGYSFSSI